MPGWTWLFPLRLYFKAMSLQVKELAAWFRSLTPEQKTLIGQVAFGIVTFQLFRFHPDGC